MSQQVAFFPIHGIGKNGSSTKPYADFIAGIRKHLPLDFELQIHPIDYSGILDKREDEIYKWVKGMSPAWDVLANKEREFASYFVADVLAYAYPKRPLQPGDFMYDLESLLAEKLAAARPDAKKVIFGHSLGSLVAFGAGWGIKTDCLITAGSPFSYFSIRYKDGGEMNPDLPQFHNFWTPRDRVSTIISKNPKFKGVHDYQVPNWNPLHWTRLGAHSLYWSSDFVHKKIAKILQAL